MEHGEDMKKRCVDARVTRTKIRDDEEEGGREHQTSDVSGPKEKGEEE